jgi:hypothetical protein
MNNDLRTQFLAEYAEEVLARADERTAESETLEAANHIDELIKANMELGDNEMDAVIHAIAHFGRSREIGKELGKSIQRHKPSKLVFWFAIAMISFLLSFGLIFVADHIAWASGMYKYSFVETDLKVAGIFTSVYATILAITDPNRIRGCVISLVLMILFKVYWYLPQVSSLPPSLTNLAYISFGALLFATPLGVLLFVLRLVGPRLTYLQHLSKPLRISRD